MIKDLVIHIYTIGTAFLVQKPADVAAYVCLAGLASLVVHNKVAVVKLAVLVCLFDYEPSGCNS